MTLIRSAIALVLVTTPAGAQQFPPGVTPKTVRPERIAPIVPSTNSPLTAMGSDGLLYIDWDLAARLADGAEENPRTALARILMAVRDGQWKHMPK